MTANDLVMLLPLIILATSMVIIMLMIGIHRSHALTATLTLIGMALAFGSIFIATPRAPQQVTSLLTFDSFAYFYAGLIIAAAFAVTALSYAYLRSRDEMREEYYLLLLSATLGSVVLAASSHFISFFLGLEILSVSLYALVAYNRSNPVNVEAGIKYLILAAASAAVLLFGMALIYAELGTMQFREIAAGLTSPGEPGVIYILAGFAMIMVGIGFKLALVPFHMWTPDVYQGAPAPVTAFVATVSKGSIFALLLRLFSRVDLSAQIPLFVIFSVLAIASMLVGNLLALRQNNVKRILAYSSIAHLGYLLVAFLASGSRGALAVTFYLVAYIVTNLVAFGVVTVLSTGERDAEDIEDYRGLFRRHPWLTLLFSASLFSLAGIPLTAGFIGKFYLVLAGAGAALWALVIILVLASTIGLFYYLRVVVALYSRPVEGAPAAGPAPSLSLAGGVVLTVLTLMLFWLGTYPTPLLQVIQTVAASLF
jgi:NADH-quinone oxidoreductase subunit N